MKLDYTHINNQKPLLVFIHGFLGSKEQWDGVRSQLASRYSYLLINLPGHGDSPSSGSAYSLHDLANLVWGLIDQLEVDRVSFIGHSMGGYVAATASYLVPHRVDHVFLINSMLSCDSAQRKTARDRSIGLIRKHQEAYIHMAITHLFTPRERQLFKEAIQGMKERANQITDQTVINALLAMRDRLDLTERFPSGIPLSYIASSHDDVIPITKILSEKMDQASVYRIDGGHMSILTHAPQVATYILESLEDR